MGKKVQNSQHFLTTIEGLEQVKLMVMLAVMLVKTLLESEKPHGMKPFLTSSKRKDSEQGKETFQAFQQKPVQTLRPAGAVLELKMKAQLAVKTKKGRTER